MIKKTLLALSALIVLLLVGVWLVGSAVLFDNPEPQSPVDIPRPPAKVSAISSDSSQILFGDLHVHTSYSLDAAIFDTPAVKGTGYTRPADACDFARYCSALDFWSINDHAEAISPWQWQATREAVRECEQVGDPDAPDLVSFLGWEWTQGTTRPDPTTHYGHKNVIFRDLGEGREPTRPIAAGNDSVWRQMTQAPTLVRGLALLGMSRLNLAGYESVAAHLKSAGESQDCERADVRDLPSDCYEFADTPTELYDKLDEWGFEALVIPHGLSWGTTNPVGSDFAYQMDEHNAKYQRLLEVNSGHGNSEVYRDMAIVLPGSTSCPAPTKDYTPCCWQAGEIIRQRCESNSGADCEDRAGRTREMFLGALDAVSMLNKARSVVPDTHPDDWGQCDQLTDSFQPAYNYQPKQSAQYMLTLGDEDKRYRPGFIGSSDNHSARPGIGYKEVSRHYMTDTKDNGLPFSPGNPEADQPVEPSGLPFMEDQEDAVNAFFYTGGLVAVHSRDRSREAIWDALQARAVYGTSGPRIGLWFELVDAEGTAHDMGSEVKLADQPTFQIGATGSIKQNPGCPDHVEAALGTERMENLCRNECFNPSDEAHRIVRLEVVKILPRSSAAEKPADLIQDPWRVIDCSDQGSHCSAEITDPDFARDGREAAYYVRAIQEATETIQGDPFRCEYDDNGSCVKTNYCVGEDQEEDCMSPAQHRAWSSPIYVSPLSHSLQP
ncbi:MAG: DUF3604 domain-containing protein [Halioglobus sp.]